MRNPLVFRPELRNNLRNISGGEGADMAVEKRGRWWYYFKRVPRRFEALESRASPIRISLKTDSETEARRRAAVVEARLFAQWEALEAGVSGDDADRFAAAVRVAASRGFPYKTAAELAAGPIDDLVRRLEALVSGATLAPPVEADALLGDVARPVFRLSDVVAAFEQDQAAELRAKSPDQVQRWRNPKAKAVANFVAVVGDKPLPDLTRDDARRFRDWWRERLAEKDQRGNTANKDINALSRMIGRLSELHELGVPDIFARLRFKEKDTGTRPPFSTKWIRDRLLAPGALDGLNGEARDALLVMVETGLRPGEIVNLLPGAIRLGDKVPHVVVEPDGREVKSAAAARAVPLVGVALDAARRNPDGFPRYRDKGASWSAAVNAFLRENALLESPDHVAYSLRHSFQDRLIAAEVPERVQAELMGHEIDRPRYGAGATLDHKRRWLLKVAVSVERPAHRRQPAKAAAR